MSSPPSSATVYWLRRLDSAKKGLGEETRFDPGFPPLLPWQIRYWSQPCEETACGEG
jgi:hypothetical protein